MKRLTYIALTMCVGLLAATPLVMAQAPQANVYFGLGTATDSSNGQALDIFGTGNALNTPKMTGLFATVGGGVMLTDHFGAGAEINWRAGQGDYAGVNYRPIFYDFNGIWQPVRTKRFVPEIQAGIGGVAVPLQRQYPDLRPTRRVLDGQSRLGKLEPFPNPFRGRRAALRNAAYLLPARGRRSLGE